MSAPEVAAAPAEATPPARRFRVEALAMGPEGAVKLMVMTTVEPDLDKLAKYKARVSAQYRQEFEAWPAEPPKVVVV